MKIDGYEALKSWPVLNGPASDDAIREAAAALRRRLPDDYVQFLREHDGGEGFVGENFLILWKAEELEACNREYEVEEYAPGLPKELGSEDPSYTTWRDVSTPTGKRGVPYRCHAVYRTPKYTARKDISEASFESIMGATASRAIHNAA